MRVRGRYAAACLLSLASWLSPAVAAEEAANPPTLPRAPAWIVHSNDILGELEPCGCRNNPQGGFAREWNWSRAFQKERAIQPAQWIRVDAGDLLFNAAELPQLLKPQSELQALYVLRAMALLQTQALVPGEKDFALGTQTLLKLIAQARKTKGSPKGALPYLAANLYSKKTGKRLFDAARVIKIPGSGGKKLALLGLVGEGLSWPSDVRASPALAEASAQVARLRKEANWVVVITHQGLEDDEKLAREVAGIDAVIGAHTQSFLQTPVPQKKALVFQTAFRNQWVGAIPLQTKLEAKNYVLAGLELQYETPSAEPATAMDALVADAKREIASLNLKAESALTRVESAPHGEAAYQTFPACAQCHLPQFVFWSRTHHAQALKPLVQAHQASNLECLQCHTTGAMPGTAKPAWKDPARLITLKDGTALTLEQSDTFLERMREAAWDAPEFKLVPADTENAPLSRQLARIDKAWTPVQCENCHGPAGDHPFSGKVAKAVETATCLRCHTPERAPGWYLPSVGGKAPEPDLNLIATKRAAVQCPRSHE